MPQSKREVCWTSIDRGLFATSRNVKGSEGEPVGVVFVRDWSKSMMSSHFGEPLPENHSFVRNPKTLIRGESIAVIRFGNNQLRPSIQYPNLGPKKENSDFFSLGG